MNIDKQKVECIQADRMNNGTLIILKEPSYILESVNHISTNKGLICINVAKKWLEEQNIFNFDVFPSDIKDIWYVG